MLGNVCSRACRAAVVSLFTGIVCLAAGEPLFAGIVYTRTSRDVYGGGNVRALQWDRYGGYVENKDWGGDDDWNYELSGVYDKGITGGTGINGVGVGGTAAMRSTVQHDTATGAGLIHFKGEGFGYAFSGTSPALYPYGGSEEGSGAGSAGLSTAFTLDQGYVVDVVLKQGANGYFRTPDSYSAQGSSSTAVTIWGGYSPEWTPLLFEGRNKSGTGGEYHLQGYFGPGSYRIHADLHGGANAGSNFGWGFTTPRETYSPYVVSAAGAANLELLVTLTPVAGPGDEHLRTLNLVSKLAVEPPTVGEVPVPEPAAVSLLGLGALALIRRRSRGSQTPSPLGAQSPASATSPCVANSLPALSPRRP